jgi:hypothetical protein
MGEAKRRGDFEVRKAQAVKKDQIIAEQAKREFLKKFEGKSINWSRLALASTLMHIGSSEV